eukprot:7022018-Ditylum_brightwellii.AAC.1
MGKSDKQIKEVANLKADPKTLASDVKVAKSTASITSTKAEKAPKEVLKKKAIPGSSLSITAEETQSAVVGEIATVQ